MSIVSAVLTNCTARKRGSGGALQLDSQQDLPIAAVACRWAQNLRKAELEQVAADLYCGRSVTTATEIAAVLGAPLFFVSAGLGLVGSADPVPRYDLTIDGPEQSLRRRLARQGHDLPKWWSLICKHKNQDRAISGLVAATNGLVYVALPATYLELVASDLDALTGLAITRLRIFTTPRGRALLPGSLRGAALPYDDRLESTFISGTQGDMAQRAMKHYVEVLGASRFRIEDGFKAVERALSALEAPIRPRRDQLSNDKIAELLLKEWDRLGGQSSRLLRFLRDEANVACEQRRFGDLWRQLKEQRPDAGRQYA